MKTKKVVALLSVLLALALVVVGCSNGFDVAGEIDGAARATTYNVSSESALKSAVKNVKASKAFKGVKVESVNGALKINVYITVEKDTVVNEIAEKVQENVKEKIQNMTRTAVTKVNVTVADVKLGTTEPVKK